MSLSNIFNATLDQMISHYQGPIDFMSCVNLMKALDAGARYSYAKKDRDGQWYTMTFSDGSTVTLLDNGEREDDESDPDYSLAGAHAALSG